MGKEQSKLAEEGYAISTQAENHVIATKGNDYFFIKMIDLNQLSSQVVTTLTSEIEALQKINHPHVVDMKQSFKDEKQNIYYVVMDHCQEGSLADKIELNPPESPQESEILNWIVEICVALETIHEAALHHKNLSPKNVLLDDFGLVRLGGFGNINESLNSPSSTNPNATLNYLAPEVFTKGEYDAKSDIWSVGCILVELCTKKKAFSAENTINLIPKIINGVCPTLPSNFSPELGYLLSDLLKTDPMDRPTASEVLAHPIALKCLTTKCTTTIDDLETKLKGLRALADGLERVHQGTTIGSLTGGVIGAVGGITSIVGLILAPFTLGASLIVTGVGVGVGAVGGVTAGASNITNMINQSSDRKVIHKMIKEFEQKTRAVVTWLLEINMSFQTISRHCPQPSDTDSNFKKENLIKLGFRAGRGLDGITELIRLGSVLTIGKIVAQTSRAVRVAEVVSGIFSGLFVAVDIFFIAMDAREIHHIRGAKEAERRDASSSSSGSKPDGNETFDTSKLLLNTEMQECDTTEPPETEGQSKIEDQSDSNKAEIRSEIMRFVHSVREAADNLEKVLKDLKKMASSISSLYEENELEEELM
uniref:non-specific serine/threonine protein kinase n=3 Tax=Iconisemion striatum TaxID=60296 RepID=A0A1A7XS68_9TELE